MAAAVPDSSLLRFPSDMFHAHILPFLDSTDLISLSFACKGTAEKPILGGNEQKKVRIRFINKKVFELLRNENRWKEKCKIQGYLDSCGDVPKSYFNHYLQQSGQIFLSPLKPFTLRHHGMRVNSMVISKTGLVASTHLALPRSRGVLQQAAAGEIRLWNLETEKMVAILPGHREPPHLMAFADDLGMLISYSTDRTVRFWKLLAPLPTQQLRDPIYSMTYGGAGDLFLGAHGSVQRWQLAPLKHPETLPGEIVGPVTSLHSYRQKDGTLYLVAATRAAGMKNVMLWIKEAPKPYTPEPLFKAVALAQKEPALEALERRNAQQACDKAQFNYNLSERTLSVAKDNIDIAKRNLEIAQKSLVYQPNGWDVRKVYIQANANWESAKSYSDAAWGNNYAATHNPSSTEQNRDLARQNLETAQRNLDLAKSIYDEALKNYTDQQRNAYSAPQDSVKGKANLDQAQKYHRETQMPEGAELYFAEAKQNFDDASLDLAVAKHEITADDSCFRLEYDSKGHPIPTIFTLSTEFGCLSIFQPRMSLDGGTKLVSLLQRPISLPNPTSHIDIRGDFLAFTIKKRPDSGAYFLALPTSSRGLLDWQTSQSKLPYKMRTPLPFLTPGWAVIEGEDELGNEFPNTTLHFWNNTLIFTSSHAREILLLKAPVF